MKKLLFILIIIGWSNSFAGGSTVSTGYQNDNLSINGNNTMLGGEDFAAAINKMRNGIGVRDSVREYNMKHNVQAGSQVYYIGQKQSELTFATQSGQDRKVNVQSLRAEEIKDSNVLDSVRKSQITRQWEKVIQQKSFNQ